MYLLQTKTLIFLTEIAVVGNKMDLIEKEEV